MHDEIEALKDPQSLDDIVGQPITRHLRAIVIEPRSQCLMFEGSIGTGKTTAAKAMARQLGCHDLMSGFFHENGSDFGKPRAEEMFNSKLRYRYNTVSGFSVLLIDELEKLSPECSGYLRSKFDDAAGLPRNVIVIATSNDSSRLDEALLDRFRVFCFSAGTHFQIACLERLAVSWERMTGESCLPFHSAEWGFKDGSFSMRRAIRDFQVALSSAARLQVA